METMVLRQREIGSGLTGSGWRSTVCLPQFYLCVLLPSPSSPTPTSILHLLPPKLDMSTCSDTLPHLDPIHIPVLWRWMITIRALIWSTRDVGFLSHSWIKVELNTPFIRRLMISTDPAQKLTFLPLLNEVRQKERFAIESKPPEWYYSPCGQVLTMCSSAVQKKIQSVVLHPIPTPVRSQTPSAVCCSKRTLCTASYNYGRVIGF